MLIFKNIVMAVTAIISTLILGLWPPALIHPASDIDTPTPSSSLSLQTCDISSFGPNPIASSNNQNIIDALPRLDSELQTLSVAGLLNLQDGELRTEWFHLQNDSETAYLENVSCGDLIVGSRDSRFAYSNTLASLERVKLWLTKIDRQSVMPSNLKVRVSETLTASGYDITSRTLTIGARQCETQSCVCRESNMCPKSSDNRSIWPHAQDGDVVVHEYSHAILHNLVCQNQSNCSLPSGRYIPALDEAFSDYLASAVNLSETAQKNDSYCFAEWYNSLNGRPLPCVRRLDVNTHWPEADAAVRLQGPYGYSQIWASALFKARKKTTPETMDRIILDAYSGLRDDMTFESMAEAILKSAEQLATVEERGAIRTIFVAQGFAKPAPHEQISFSEGQEFAISQSLSNWDLSAFPVFDHTVQITRTGSEGLKLAFDKIRLESGDCFSNPCGRIHLMDSENRIHQTIGRASNGFTSSIIPGDTIKLRFVGSYNHRRSGTIFSATTLTAY